MKSNYLQFHKYLLKNDKKEKIHLNELSEELKVSDQEIVNYIKTFVQENPDERSFDISSGWLFKEFSLPKPSFFTPIILLILGISLFLLSFHISNAYIDPLKLVIRDNLSIYSNVSSELGFYSFLGYFTSFTGLILIPVSILLYIRRYNDFKFKKRSRKQIHNGTLMNSLGFSFSKSF